MITENSNWLQQMSREAWRDNSFNMNSNDIDLKLQHYNNDNTYIAANG